MGEEGRGNTFLIYAAGSTGKILHRYNHVSSAGYVLFFDDNKRIVLLCFKGRVCITYLETTLKYRVDI